MMLRQILPAIMGSCLLLGASLCRGDDPPPTKLNLAEGSVKLTVPDSWKKVEPKSSMIQYEFRAPKEGKEEEQARITFMPAGGGIDSNIERWKGQFDIAKEEDAKVEKKEIAGLEVHCVDISGTFKESMGGPFAGGKVRKLEGYRMLGAIIETKKQGLVFIKMTGPAATLESLHEEWGRMLEKMEAE